MKELKDRTVEGLLELFSDAQIAAWCEKYYGCEGGNDKKYNELKAKSNDIRKEIVSRAKQNYE